MSQCLTVSFAVPSAAHDKNHALHWRKKRLLWAEARDDAIYDIRSQFVGLSTYDPFFTTPVRVGVLWRYSRGTQPDFDNALARCSHFFDAFTHTGVWSDDQLMQAVEFDFERVPTGEEEVTLKIRPIKKFAKI